MIPRRDRVECENVLLRVRIDIVDSMSSNRCLSAASISSWVHLVLTYTFRPSDPSELQELGVTWVCRDPTKEGYVVECCTTVGCF